MTHGYYSDVPVTQRHIWVKRDDGALELKIWFIYTFKFVGDSADKITNFLDAEIKRYHWQQNPDAAQLKNAVQDYQNLDYSDNHLPPRLWAVAADTLQTLETDLFTNEHGFVYGDSIGGMAPGKPPEHDAHLKNDVVNQQTILFNPGVLGRIIVEKDGQDHYVFQLSQKNLAKKGQIFYKPIGGHLKVKAELYDALVRRYKLIPKVTDNPHDGHDVAFTIPQEKFDSFTELFLDDIVTTKTFATFDDPAHSMISELFEELGPVSSIDGINLLSAQDLIEQH